MWIDVSMAAADPDYWTNRVAETSFRSKIITAPRCRMRK